MSIKLINLVTSIILLTSCLSHRYLEKVKANIEDFKVVVPSLLSENKLGSSDSIILKDTSRIHLKTICIYTDTIKKETKLARFYDKYDISRICIYTQPPNDTLFTFHKDHSPFRPALVISYKLSKKSQVIYPGILKTSTFDRMKIIDSSFVFYKIKRFGFGY